MSIKIEVLQHKAVKLLSEIIAIPSFSREEEKVVKHLSQFFEQQKIPVQIIGNNVIAKNKFFNKAKPTLLLNSHMDTVKPNAGYTINPFEPITKDDKLFGLGSNDAGGCLISLLMCFLKFYEEQNLKYNIIFAATAEEEISGKNGVEMILTKIEKIDCTIVGEPTQMQLAIAERGLMVVDCFASGVAGHSARNEGVNALYIALDDIQWIRNYSFEKISEFLGNSKFTVSVINTENTQHNIVPPQCQFVIDIRLNELYSFEEILEVLQKNLKSKVLPRSMRLRSTMISLEHPLVKAGVAMGLNPYGSPTTSDKALMNFPALKMGPGDSARSHMADEFIFINEIHEAIKIYCELLSKVVMNN